MLNARRRGLEGDQCGPVIIDREKKIYRSLKSNHQT